MTVISRKIFTYKSHGTKGETDSSIRGFDGSIRPVKSKGSTDSKGPVSALMKGPLDTNRLAGPMESALRLPAVLLGICFLVLFSGFSTLSNLQKTILASVRDEQPDFTGDGYISLGILYSVFAVSLWITPSIISVTGPVLAMVVGAAGYVLFPISFILESTFALYFGAFINGIGSALLWNGQANYLIVNSKPGQISKNVGLFWGIYTIGMLPGNLLVFFAFKDKQKHIDAPTRVFILTALSLVMALGVILMYFLRCVQRPTPLAEGAVTVQNVIPKTRGPGEAFRTALRLSVTRPMLWLLLPFSYAGLQLSFSSSVYSASVGFTLQMGRSTKQLVPLAGILTGLGEITGGTLPFVFHNRKCCGLSLIMLTGLLSNLMGYAMVYVNIPNVAPLGNTWETSLIPPNEYLAVFCSFLMGVGDCCIHNELYSILGSMYPDDSAEVFAVFKFVRCISTAAIFYCSSSIGLHAQLFLQVLSLALCALCYVNIQLNILDSGPSNINHIDPSNKPSEQSDMNHVDQSNNKTSDQYCNRLSEQTNSKPSHRCDKLQDDKNSEASDDMNNTLTTATNKISEDGTQNNNDSSEKKIGEGIVAERDVKDDNMNVRGGDVGDTDVKDGTSNADTNVDNVGSTIKTESIDKRDHSNVDNNESPDDNIKTNKNLVLDRDNGIGTNQNNSTKGDDPTYEFNFTSLQANNLHIENFICK